MDNLLESLRQLAPDTLLVRVFGYGYLDSLLQDYQDGKTTEVVLRRQHYMLQKAVEVRLQELEAQFQQRVQRSRMIQREQSIADEPGPITKR